MNGFNYKYLGLTFYIVPEVYHGNVEDIEVYGYGEGGELELCECPETLLGDVYRDIFTRAEEEVACYGVDESVNAIRGK